MFLQNAFDELVLLDLARNNLTGSLPVLILQVSEKYPGFDDLWKCSVEQSSVDA